MDSRIGEIESNNVKDLTLTINELQSMNNRLQMMTEDIRLIKQEQLLQSDKSLSRYLEMNEIFRMTLEAHVNDKFEVLEDAMKQVAIQVKDTYLGSQMKDLVAANEAIANQIHDIQLTMVSIKTINQDREIVLENQLSKVRSSVTNLEDMVLGLKGEFKELKE